MPLNGDPNWPLSYGADWLFSRGPDWTVHLSTGLDWVTPVITLVSVFLGAYLAFKHQNRRENKQQNQRNINAINRALFTLYRYREIQISFSREIIDPIRDRDPSTWWIDMAPALTGHFQRIPMVTDDLNFILSSESPDICSYLFLEEQSYNIFLQLQHDRCSAYNNELAPRLEALNMTNENRPSNDEIAGRVGRNTYHTLMDLTESIVNSVRSNLVSIMSIHDRLREYAISMYPDATFIEIRGQERQPEQLIRFVTQGRRVIHRYPD